MFPEIKTARPRSQFPHSCYREFHEGRNWERGRAVSFLGIFVSNFDTLSLQRSFFQIETFIYYKILQAGIYYFCGNLVLKKVCDKKSVWNLANKVMFLILKMEGKPAKFGKHLLTILIIYDIDIFWKWARRARW